ncbi:MAG TPA: hypothetical protein VF717_09440 [Pyrinomonadaceae bacterium]
MSAGKPEDKNETERVERLKTVSSSLVAILPQGQVSDFTFISPDVLGGWKYVQISLDQVRLETTIRILESHVEGETLVIDSAQIVEMSICSAPNPEEDSLDARS